MADTAAASSRLIRSPSTTRGTKSNSTPKGLNSTVMAPSSCATGTGYSPPARKVASCPERAVRFGSANVRTTPLFSRASRRTPTSNAPTPNWNAKAPTVPSETVTGLPRPLSPDSQVPVSIPSPSPPTASDELSDLETERCISAKRTLSMTCCTPPTTIRLETRWGA